MITYLQIESHRWTVRNSRVLVGHVFEFVHTYARREYTRNTASVSFGTETRWGVTWLDGQEAYGPKRDPRGGFPTRKMAGAFLVQHRDQHQPKEHNSPA